MHKYYIKTRFVIPEFPKARTDKTGYNTIRYMIFQYGLEPALIQRILIGFKAILE